MKNVLNFVKKHGKLISSEITWKEDKGFIGFPKGLTDDRGVYFVVSQYGIEKVGKADGKFGFKGRMISYKSSINSKNKSPRDASCKLWEEMMMSELHGEVLSIYFIDVPLITQKIHGVEVITSAAREFEEQMSIAAREANQPMRLAGRSN